MYVKRICYRFPFLLLPFVAPKIAFGNRLLTTIGVWLEG